MSAHPYRDAFSTYRRTQIETASPHKLIAMLLQGAIQRCEQARTALSEGKVETARPLLIRSQEIVTELMMALDFERGGEIAQNLLRLYEFVHGRLVEANVRRNPSAIEEALVVLRGVAEAWAAIAPGRESAAGTAATGSGPDSPGRVNWQS